MANGKWRRCDWPTAKRILLDDTLSSTIILHRNSNSINADLIECALHKVFWGFSCRYAP